MEFPDCGEFVIRSAVFGRYAKSEKIVDLRRGFLENGSYLCDCSFLSVWLFSPRDARRSRQRALRRMLGQTLSLRPLERAFRMKWRREIQNTLVLIVLRVADNVRNGLLAVPRFVPLTSTQKATIFASKLDAKAMTRAVSKRAAQVAWTIRSKHAFRLKV